MKYIKTYESHYFDNTTPDYDDYHTTQEIWYDISDEDDYDVTIMKTYNGMNIIISRNDHGLMGLNTFSDIIKRTMESIPDYNITIKLDRNGEYNNLKIVGDGDGREKITPVMTTDDYTGQTYMSATTHTMGSKRLFNLMNKKYTFSMYQTSIYYAARKIIINITK